jgi:hypothetical protein
MGVNIHNLIAAISPDVYCDPSVRDDVKFLIREEGYLKAAEKAVPAASDILFDFDEAKKDALGAWGLKSPTEHHSLTYDSFNEELEPLYFWILDYLNNAAKEVDKITDNFVSSVGSGHHSELMSKASQMQQEATRILAGTNAVIKQILNIIYDLKDFKLRLDIYDRFHSKDKNKKGSALLSLKQIWMDTVDIKRGNSSLISLSQRLDYATLIDGYMAARSLEDVKKLDLNDRVKRILEQRIGEFLTWTEQSERELRKRFEIERKYLKTQVDTVKLYSRWVKPYLKAAAQLEQNASPNASLVNTFSVIIKELTLLAKNDYKPEGDIAEGLLPAVFSKVPQRKYSSIVLVEFNFRGVPRKIGQSYTFGGRSEIKFTSYALNDQEIKVLKEQLERDDFGDVMRLVEGATTESLEQMQADIDEFLNEDSMERKKEKNDLDVNPFSALFSFLKRDKKSKKTENEIDLSKGIKPDSHYEKIIRSQAIINARDSCFNVYDVYKKSHAMPSHNSPFDAI